MPARERIGARVPSVRCRLYRRGLRGIDDPLRNESGELSGFATHRSAKPNVSELRWIGDPARKGVSATGSWLRFG